MEVSWNRGTPKSSILMVFSIINHPFGGTPISKKKTHSLGLPVGYILNCILISTDPTRHPGRNRPSTCHRCSWSIEYHYQRYASTAGKHAVAWQKNAGNHSRSAAVFIMLSVYIHIYIYIMYIHKYIHVYKLFSDTPEMWCGLIWFDLDGSATTWSSEALVFVVSSSETPRPRRGPPRELLENVEHTQHG